VRFKKRHFRHSFLLTLIVSFSLKAYSVEILERSRPKSLEPMTQTVSPNVREITPSASEVEQPSSELERRLAEYLKADDCNSVVASVNARDYEILKPEILAVLAYCEPPGKDPEKMFLFAETKAAGSDVVLLLHARYRWKKQRADAEDLFLKLRDQTKDPQLKKLAQEYLFGEEPNVPRDSRLFGYIVSGNIGGIQEGNPQGLSLSDSGFGKASSTAGVAQLAVTLRKPIETYLFGLNFVANDITYWRTHDVDLSTNDLDFTAVHKISESSTIGLRPFGSFYLLQGARYYSLYGMALTGSHLTDWIDQWLQLSYYNDKFCPDEAKDQGGSHLRADWQSALKIMPILQPTLFAYVDRGVAGVDVSGGRFIPYSNVTYAFGGSFNRLVHRYSVGLSGRVVYREDSQSTRITDPNGLSVSKRRQDLQFVVQPNLTVPLVKGVELFLYFESNSVSSTLKESDGLDRNISDNTLGALVRMSVAN
jgi:hypothetical protein